MPLVIASAATEPITDWVADYRERNPHVAVVQGLALTFSALSRLIPSEAGSVQSAPIPPATETNVLSEADSRAVLEDAGASIVHGVIDTDDAGAAAAAAELTPPFAVKIVAPTSHKSRIGGVALGVASVADLAPTINRMRTTVATAGLAENAIEGYLIEEMVFGSEILVGLNTDPAFGKYLVVGLGGTATEIANRSSTRRLPLGDDARALLAEVGIHNHPRAEGLITSLCREFEGGSLAAYRTIEVNPLIVNANECWAADAVVVRAAEPEQTAPIEARRAR
jgi:succinyl-CoA synthetase beta subunit